MRVLSVAIGVAVLVASAGAANAEEVEIGDWTFSLPAGFSKLADSCDSGG